MRRRDFTRAAAASLGIAALRPLSILRARPTSAPTSADLAAGLAELVKKHRVPGALAGVYRDGQVMTAGAGIANLNTGQPMTAGLGYLTGSITKVWTCTLLMTFVDEGRIDLDRPLIEYLPHLTFGDMEVARHVTTKHLLNHSSGLDAGDYIEDFGEGPSANRLYVEALARIGQIHPMGKYSSYNNAGWIIAGHLMETLSGKSWHRLLDERVIKPLGATRTFPDAEDGVLHGMAVGSVPDPNRPGEHMATPKLLLPKTFAPAGATLVPTLDDNLLLARMHMRLGLAPNGNRVISEKLARAMQTRTIDHPSGPTTGFALGWGHSTAGGQVSLSHGGGSNGGRAQLVAVPGSDFAYATFINSNASDAFATELHAWLVEDFHPNPPVAPPVPTPPANVPLAPFTGVFRRMTSKTTIEEEGQGLGVTSEWIPAEAPGTEAYMIGRPVKFAMKPSAANALIPAGAKPEDRPTAWTFLEPGAEGKYGYLYAGGRLSRRIA
ncbi:MAG TPA: serine hydrolase domain-containing protein [Gemmatimonadales bacterium]|nr:serine hydrolase domain-containing protein [Gemmatimonadales bacterium]